MPTPLQSVRESIATATARALAVRQAAVDAATAAHAERDQRAGGGTTQSEASANARPAAGR